MHSNRFYLLLQSEGRDFQKIITHCGDYVWVNAQFSVDSCNIMHDERSDECINNNNNNNNNRLFLSFCLQAFVFVFL